MPEGFELNVNDTYGIQEICAYEVAAFGSSDFCSLFTLAEWQGFEYSTDLAYYGDYSVSLPFNHRKEGNADISLHSSETQLVV